MRRIGEALVTVAILTMVISLTVAEVTDEAFTVAVIPHTAEVTTLGRRTVDDLVNVEVDVLAKYVERQLTLREVNA